MASNSVINDAKRFKAPHQSEFAGAFVARDDVSRDDKALREFDKNKQENTENSEADDTSE